MLACYPEGSTGYRPHRDAAELTSHRALTAILYLNDGWSEGDGGELVLQPAAGSDAVRVCPELNRLLAFRTDLEHEVLPNCKQRLAITTWLQLKPGGDGHPAPPPSSAPSANAVAPGAGGEQHLATIFVSVPAFRDPEMQHTLYDLFAKAAHSERVSVGLVWQGDTETGDDAHCFTRRLPAQWQSRVRTHWLHYREARGPTLARALAQRLWRGESHYLQIDSHSRFASDWDEVLLAQLAAAEVLAAREGAEHGVGSDEPARAIITTYPAGYERPDTRSQDDRPPLMCARAVGGEAFGADGLLRLRARTLRARPAQPMPSLFWAAGFAFSRASVIERVPYDAHLPFLFFGEETSMAARLWTAGYDFYAPTTNIVYHLWDRSYRELFWQVGDPDGDKPRSVARVQQLLAGAGGEASALAGLSSEAAPLGLGSARTLAQYEAFCGVSFGVPRSASERAAVGGQDEDAFEPALGGLTDALRLVDAAFRGPS
mmetsp:Transcript_15604/g.39691  ORF Transcript_15604/g.39691 Transcript_15604/m.39691 type:complete len:487 (-) Transcript_15604:101-1561(-)